MAFEMNLVSIMDNEPVPNMHPDDINLPFEALNEPPPWTYASDDPRLLPVATHRAQLDALNERYAARRRALLIRHRDHQRAADAVIALFRAESPPPDEPDDPDLPFGYYDTPAPVRARLRAYADSAEAAALMYIAHARIESALFRPRRLHQERLLARAHARDLEAATRWGEIRPTRAARAGVNVHVIDRLARPAYSLAMNKVHDALLKADPVEIPPEMPNPWADLGEDMPTQELITARRRWDASRWRRRKAIREVLGLGRDYGDRPPGAVPTCGRCHRLDHTSTGCERAPCEGHRPRAPICPQNVEPAETEEVADEEGD